MRICWVLTIVENFTITLHVHVYAHYVRLFMLNFLPLAADSSSMVISFLSCNSVNYDYKLLELQQCQLW